MYQPFETLELTGGCVAVIGSGGKTTLLRRLSEALPGSVILTTSTRIYPFEGIPLVQTGADGGRALRDIRSTLKRSRVVCVGTPEPSGKLAAPGVPFETLLELADAVLVEADGAAGRPLKAHRPWEPVIPSCAGITICVVGASGFGRPAIEACHCPELFCELAGIAPDAPVDVEAVARVLNRECLADYYLVNQIDALPDKSIARRLCDLIDKPAGMISLG